MPEQKKSFTLSSDYDGWRVGRNPPSVRSSICLIGEPAPRAELTDVYIPFHSAVGARFIPRPALHPGRPGEHPIIVTRYRPGIVSALPHRLSPDTLRVALPPCGWSFLKTHSLRHAFCDCSPTRHPGPENFAPANRLIQNRTIRKECCVESASVLISLRTWIPPGTAPWAIGDRGLNVSTEVLTRTPRFHQPHLLWEHSSQSHNAVASAGIVWTGMVAYFRERFRA